MTNPAEVLDYLASQPRDPNKGDWRIAKITDTFLGYEDHGILTIMLTVDYGGSGQGVGMYDLGSDSRDARPGEWDRWIRGVLSACGVRQWERIRDRTIMVLIEGGVPSGIKPLPTEDGRPFFFKEEK